MTGFVLRKPWDLNVLLFPAVQGWFLSWELHQHAGKPAERQLAYNQVSPCSNGFFCLSDMWGFTVFISPKKKKLRFLEMLLLVLPYLALEQYYSGVFKRGF